MKIDNELNFSIEGWMTKLELKPLDLLVYAIIYSFTKNDKKFFGSMEYLSKFFNCTPPTINSALKSLTLNGYILKTENYRVGFVCRYFYTTNMEIVNKLKEE